jgi:hypothetical protein
MMCLWACGQRPCVVHMSTGEVAALVAPTWHGTAGHSVTSRNTMGDGQHRNLPTSVAHGWPRSPEQRARHRDKYRDTDPPAAQSRPPAHGAVRQHSCKLCRSATQRLSRGVSYVIFPTRGDRPSLLSLTSHPSCRAIHSRQPRPRCQVRRRWRLGLQR